MVYANGDYSHVSLSKYLINLLSFKEKRCRTQPTMDGLRCSNTNLKKSMRTKAAEFSNLYERANKSYGFLFLGF